jgi:ABC-type transport system involved in multi-copper enzyme maturation permease subunit
MSNVTVQTRENENFNSRKFDSSSSAEPAWRVMLTTELADLWLGGKAVYLILAFSILLGIESFVLATNFELSLFTPPEMVFEILKSALQVSLLIGLIIGADSISGERERATLEGILLTPASRRQILFGKFLSALSAWPITFAITIPFLLLLAQGSKVLGVAVVWGVVVGILLIPAFTAVGMLVSLWCNSNKTSFFIGLGIFLVFILMGQVLGTTKLGLWGQLLLWLNPIPAGFDFLSMVIVNHGTFDEVWTSLEAPFVFSVAVMGLLFFFFGPRLNIEGRMRSDVRELWSRIRGMMGIAVIACLMLLPRATSALAFEQAAIQAGDLQISISMDSKTLQTGDSVSFDTVLTNVGTEDSPPTIAAMNIINLSKNGDVVDPEDWSPERTQYLDSLGANETETLSWEVNAVLDGNYMVYIVAVPEPEGEGTSTQAVASRGLHLSITKFTTLNPSGVLPYAIGVPVVVVLAIFLLFRLRGRQIDRGGTQE